MFSGLYGICPINSTLYKSTVVIPIITGILYFLTVNRFYSGFLPTISYYNIANPPLSSIIFYSHNNITIKFIHTNTTKKHFPKVRPKIRLPGTFSYFLISSIIFCSARAASAFPLLFFITKPTIALTAFSLPAR